MAAKKAIILGNTNLNYSWFVLTFRQGLRLNGVEVRNIDYKSTAPSIIRKKILDYKPDVVFTHLSFHSHIHPTNAVLNFFKEIKSKIDIKIVHTCQDARTHDRYMGDLRGSFDCAFVGTYPMVANCKKMFKIPVVYSPYSSLTYDEMGQFSSDLAFKNPVFTGSPGAHRQGWADNRAGFIENLQKIMNIKIFKTQSGQDLRKRTPELSVSAKLILCLCVGYEIDGYMDVRPFQYLGTGACCVIRKFKNMDDFIPEDLYWPINGYSDKDIMKIKEYHQRSLKENTTEMRNKAFRYIQDNHSSKKRLEHVLWVLNQL